MKASGQAEESPRARKLQLVGIGDSISAGFNVSKFGLQPKMSWISGEERGVNSIRARLENRLGESIEVRNFAIAGAKAEDLDWQNLMLGSHKADIAIVLIGANDLCNGLSTDPGQLATFQKNVNTSVARLVRNAPEVKIVLVPIPQVLNLREQGAAKGCRQKWSEWGICQRVLAENVSQQQLDDFSDSWRAANTSLEMLAARYPDNVVFPAGLADFKFNPLHVSDVDCFHPSEIGQRMIADFVWEHAFEDAILK